ncbi:MAG: MobQ family relaxase [Cyanobacteria bacterium P01_C01_bin.121]
MAVAVSGYYRCSVRPLSRSTGASATAAAAYRAGERIHDDRTGLTHDYQRRTGVEAAEIITPKGVTWVRDRSQLWNAAEQAERKRNARVAREAIICFPHQLASSERSRTGRELGEWLSNRYNVAVDIAWHQPDKRGDQRNYHAHVLFTTRELTVGGFGKKTRILDDKTTGPEQVQKLREQWADIVNASLKRSGSDVRVDHRSLKDQGLDIKPGVHMGRQATTMERRGMKTDVGDLNRAIQADNSKVVDLQHQIVLLEQQLALEQRQLVQDKAIQSQEMVKRTYQHDRTRTAVERQLKGMRAERYDIGILQPADAKGDRKMLRRFWMADELFERDPLTSDIPKLAWLKRQNWNGADIYVRPDPRSGQNSGLILVDDLTIGQIEQMKQQGVKPAVVTETSAHNYQAWIRVSDHTLNAEMATEIGRVLAKRFGGDPASVDWMHYCRMAGFTNRKGHHTQADGKQPFVKLDSYYGKQASSAAEIVQEAQRRIQARQPVPLSRAATDSASAAPEVASATEKQKALDWWMKSRSRYQADLGDNDSRIDWHQCIGLHRAGYTKASVAYALRYGRPDIEDKKKGHVDDYITRTVEKSEQWVQGERTQSAPAQSAVAEKGLAKPAQGQSKQSERSPEDQRALIEQWRQLRDDQERSRERVQADQPPPARSETESNRHPSSPHRPHNVRTANVLYTYDFDDQDARYEDYEPER